MGNMSLVGPRPDIVGYYDTLEGEDKKVLELKPGITCAASIKYANEEEILSLYAADEGTMQRVTDADAANLAVIQANLPEAQARFKMRIIKDRLVEQPKLVMFSDRDELEGNGEDKATLTIQVQDDKGKVISKANDAVLVTTTRGKLSERGGEIVLEKGRASITLTSVPETVRVVTVRAELVKGGAKPVEIRLAFM